MDDSDPGSEDFPFDYRTTNDRFQEKLRAAQEYQADQQILNHLERNNDSSNQDKDLEQQRDQLLERVKKAEAEVESLRNQLAQRKKRREYEAAIMKLTPEERADAMEVDDNNDIADMNVIFEYLIRIGSAPPPTNAADMSGSNFIQGHDELREKAMDNPKVLEQNEFAHIRFTKANNQISDTNDGSVRYCELQGQTYEQDFSVSFEVLQSKLSISNLAFTVSVDFEMDAGPVLEQIKVEGNLLAFFRLLVHYAKLYHERSAIFESLKKVYASRDVFVEQISFEQLKFSNPEHSDLELTLTWRNCLHNFKPTKSFINICEQVMPEIGMEGKGFFQDDLTEQLPANFSKLTKVKGVLLASQIIINAAFQSKLV